MKVWPNSLIIFVFVSYFTIVSASFGVVSISARFPKLRSIVSNNTCVERLEAFEELKYIKEDKELTRFFSYKNSAQKADAIAALTKGLAGLSSDLLVKYILFFEQNIFTVCESKLIREFTEKSKREYLNRLHITLDQYSTKDIDLLFCGLLLPEKELEQARLNLEGSNQQLAARALIKKALKASYIELVKGVVVLASRESYIGALGKVVSEVCGLRDNCPLWDMRFVKRVMIVEERGVAVYLPEISVLLLSSSLLGELNQLNKLIILHELTHVAQSRAIALYDDDWKSQYFGFSGWKKDLKGDWSAEVKDSKAVWQDLLSQLAAMGGQSGFDLGPDRVFVGVRGSDGMVTARGYLESVSRRDPAEELSDHIAMFFVFPDRFCFSGKPLAPRKYAWILGKKLSSSVNTPLCLRQP